MRRHDSRLVSESQKMQTDKDIIVTEMLEELPIETVLCDHTMLLK